MVTITPAQLRAARALLDWSQTELAQRAGVAWSTVRDFEASRRSLRRTSLDAILAAFAPHVVFFGEQEVSPTGGVGVRLVAQPQTKSPPTQRGRSTTAPRKRPKGDLAPTPMPPAAPPPTPSHALDERLAQLSQSIQDRQKTLDALRKRKGDDPDAS